MLNSINKRFIPAFISTTVILAIILVGFVVFSYYPIDNLAQEGHCNFSQQFHLYCPGCGGTRAVESLLHGHVITSFMQNPVPVYAILLFLRIWIALFHNTFFCKIQSKLWIVLYSWEAWGILFVVVGNFIIRNLLLVFFGWDYLGDMTQYY